MPPIDFITVSRNPQRVQTLAQSIKLAMEPALAYKLTVMDGNRCDLFTGYNAAAAQTTGDILAFIHDDVQLLCNALVFARPVELLHDPGTGFIGVSGSRFIDTTGTWWGGNVTIDQSFKNCRGMVLHAAENEFGVRALMWPGSTAEFGQVIVVDGALLMCHRRTFNRLSGFDAATYQGFHFYDVDTTFRAHQLGLKNYAAPVPLLHGSTGKLDEEWERNRRIFAEKYRAVLPKTL